jgi:hypothetical protein
MGPLDPETLRDGLAAGSVAAILSGAPSTAHALLTGRDPLEAALAAGTLVLRAEQRPGRLLLAAAPVHVVLSLGWALLLAVALPRRRTAAWATVAGLGIAALDLGLIGRRFPRIRALAQLPQVLDHLAYGAAVGTVLTARRRASGLISDDGRRAAGRRR